VATLVSGNIAGVVATESLTINGVSGSEQAIVGPSTLVTSGSLLVPVGPIGQSTTAIAIANPSLGAGGVNLILTDANGSVAVNAIIQLGPRGQFSRFLNEFFTTEPAARPAPFLLTISSEIPVAILALNFRGADFASIPLTSLSPTTSVPVQTLTPTTATASNPGFGIGLPSATATTASVSPPITTGTTPAPATVSIGGATSLVFAAVATGGGWSTDIAIGNTSSAIQSMRIDFFGQDGSIIASVTDIIIPPLGVFFFSANSAGTTVQ
jgi:hypothetical protein